MTDQEKDTEIVTMEFQDKGQNLDSSIERKQRNPVQDRTTIPESVPATIQDDDAVMKTVNDQGELESQESLSVQLDDVLKKKVKRRMSKLERDTLSSAVAEVRKVAERYQDDGLSPWTFFMGQGNVAIIFYVVGHNPESYWILVMLKCYFYLALSWKLKCKTNTDLWYMIEFCWMACHIYMIWLTFAFASGCGANGQWLSDITNNKTSFYIFWGLANGPFAFSVIVFKNALVLHDVPNLASTFIHLTPSTLSWTMRWWAPQMMETWNRDDHKIFDLPDPKDTLSESFLTVVGPAYAFYACWWVMYVFYMFFYGRYIGSPWHKYDTLYFWTMQSNKPMAKAFGFDCSTPEKRIRMLPIMKYMTFNIFFFGCTIAFSYLVYLNFWVHTAFVLYLFSSVCYYGALRYFNMMTKYYVKKVENLINKRIAASGEQDIEEDNTAKTANQIAPESKPDDE